MTSSQIIKHAPSDFIIENLGTDSIPKEHDFILNDGKLNVSIALNHKWSNYWVSLKVSSESGVYAINSYNIKENFIADGAFVINGVSVFKIDDKDLNSKVIPLISLLLKYGFIPVENANKSNNQNSSNNTKNSCTTEVLLGVATGAALL